MRLIRKRKRKMMTMTAIKNRISVLIITTISVCIMFCASGCAAPESEPEKPLPVAEGSSTDRAESEYSSTEESSDAETTVETEEETVQWVELGEIPDYTDAPSYVINKGVPYFSKNDLNVSDTFESYGELDEYGRCTAASALLSKETMPAEERGPIGSIQPTGWHTVKYENITDLYLYNRCHLIAFELCGQNDNIRNLITGTRYMNIEGMLPYENEVADYMRATDNHVLYRVTPVFEDKNLVASGVVIEAESIEDDGAGISICSYCYNVQPGIVINYENGESELSEEAAKEIKEEKAAEKASAAEAESKAKEKLEAQQSSEEGGVIPLNPESVPSAGSGERSLETGGSDNSSREGDASNFNLYNNPEQQQTSATYVLNTNTMKIHHPDCKSVPKIKPENYAVTDQSLEELKLQGYTTCGNCFN